MGNGNVVRSRELAPTQRSKRIGPLVGVLESGRRRYVYAGDDARGKLDARATLDSFSSVSAAPWSAGGGAFFVVGFRSSIFWTRADASASDSSHQAPGSCARFTNRLGSGVNERHFLMSFRTTDDFWSLGLAS
jgi:hypothetical protein